MTAGTRCSSPPSSLLAWNPYERARPRLPAVVRGGALDLRARAALPPRARGLPGAATPARCRLGLGGLRARHRAGLLVPVPRVPLLTVPANAAAAPGDRADARARARLGRRRARRARRRRSSSRWLERLVRGVPRGLRAAVRRAAGRADPLAGRRPPRSPRACSWPRPMLVVVATELKPAYLLTGSDRPKIERALRRLRERIGDDATEHLSARDATAADVIASCNSMGLFGGGAARDRRGAGALEGRRREGDRRLHRVACSVHRARARRGGDQERLRARESGRQERSGAVVRGAEAKAPGVGRRAVRTVRREGRPRCLPRARGDGRRRPRRARERGRQALDLGRGRARHAPRRRADGCRAARRLRSSPSPTPGAGGTSPVCSRPPRRSWSGRTVPAPAS